MIVQHLLCVPALVAASAALVAVATRCVTLLVGFLTALPKTARGDRPEIFREFARAVSSRPTSMSSMGAAPWVRVRNIGQKRRGN